MTHADGTPCRMPYGVKRRAMTRNEAAERLRRSMAGSEGELLLDEALAVERRATVERIRARLGEAYLGGGEYAAQIVDAILDEEAAR